MTEPVKRAPARPPPKPPARPPDKPSGNPKKGRGPSWSKAVVFLVLAVVLSLLVWVYLLHRTPPPPVRWGTSAPAVRVEDYASQQTKAQQGKAYAGLPRIKGGDTAPSLLYNQAYIVGYSELREDPLWVAFRLDRAEKAMQGKRSSKFFVDKRTKAMVHPKEYQKSGYDRGHLAPSFGIGHCFGPEAQNETFLMSNIAPQRPNLNRKVWKELETQEDEYADDYGPIWVFAGPVFDDRRQLFEDGVEIPDQFFKILVDENRDQIRVLPFLFPQEVKGNEPLEQFLVSIDEIERVTGLDFLWSLSDPNEDRLEAYKPPRLW